MTVKIIIAAFAAGLGQVIAKDLQEAGVSIEVVDEALQGRRFFVVKDGPPPLYDPSHRKSKGQKKRARSALRSKGWR